MPLHATHLYFDSSWNSCRRTLSVLFCTLALSCSAGQDEGGSDAAASRAEELTKLLQPMTRTADAAPEVAAPRRATATAFTWPLPSGWWADDFALPPAFAPTLPYTGTAYLQQAPKFSSPDSADYWSYSFAWLITSGPRATEAQLEADFVDYYLGLAGDCVDPEFPCDPDAFAAEFHQLARWGHGKNAVRVFAGHVEMIEPFFTGLPLTMQMLTIDFTCASGQRVLLTSASPRSFDDPMWTTLLLRQAAFRCS